MNKDPTGTYRDFLLAFHKPLQKIVVFAVGPLSVALYLIGWLSNPTWHNLVLLLAISGMAVAWLVALFQLFKDKLESSVMIFVISVILFEMAELSLQSGSEATSVLGCFAVLAYATLYSKRYVYIASILTGVTIVFSETVKFLKPWSIQVPSAEERLITQIAFTLLLIPVMVIILRKRQNINDKLFDDMQQSVKSQGQVITTANKIQPVINEAVGRIKGISNNFVSQASEQASATTEVATTVEEVRAIAEQSSGAAARASEIAERTRQESMESRSRLAAVENGFARVLETMDGSRKAVSQLASTADNVEEVLNYNREIGEHIKVLAVNASLEAAKAGQFGAGFRVVAEELREMIVNTDENLRQSSQLLDTIRLQAKENAEISKRASDTLRQYFQELKAAGELIGSVAESFVDTSQQVGLIAESAAQQKTSISQVSAALSQIDTAAGQLEEAARVLLDGVDDIVVSHEELKEVLSIED